jgi:hypothetical protein
MANVIVPESAAQLGALQMHSESNSARLIS